jgi:phosphate transport system permease protein
MQRDIAAAEPERLGGVALEQALRKRWGRAPWERVIVLSLWLCGTVSMVTTVLIVLTLAEETRSFFMQVPIRDFLFDTRWTPQFEPTHFGVWPLVFGTLNVLIWSMLFALPLGLAAAVFLSEYAHPNTRRVLKPVLEALAGVPTVVYAFFALTVVTQEFLRPLLGDDRVPIFNSLSASIVMAVMILPTIASVSEDAMSSVPRELREAAYGLGATRLEVAARVVFPAALGGIIASVLLAVSRVIGETMIVGVAAGSTPQITLNPLESVQTMTGYMLAIGLGDLARGTIDYMSIFAVASALFIFTLFANIAATILVRKFKEQYE